jgi:hypothetical protein
MSIKSQRNNLDLNNMVISKQRDPDYIAKSKSKKMPMIENIDKISPYVDSNLKKVVKPRNKEYR